MRQERLAQHCHTKSDPARFESPAEGLELVMHIAQDKLALRNTSLHA